MCVHASVRVLGITSILSLAAEFLLGAGWRLISVFIPAPSTVGGAGGAQWALEIGLLG